MIHTIYKHLATNSFTLLVCKHPFWSLRMPDKTMADSCHIMFLGKGYKTITTCPVIAILFRMNNLTLHTVLSNNTIKIISYCLCSLWICFSSVPCVKRTTNKEVLTNYIFHCWLTFLLSHTNHRCKHQRSQRDGDNSFIHLFFICDFQFPD